MQPSIPDDTRPRVVALHVAPEHHAPVRSVDEVVAETGAARLPRLRVYLRAMLERIEKAPTDIARDAERQGDVDHVRAELDKLLDALPDARHTDPDVVALRWMIEELRVSLFAQTVGTPRPVSEQRVYKAIDALL